MNVLMIMGCYLIALLCSGLVYFLIKKLDTRKWYNTFLLFVVGCVGLIFFFLPANIYDDIRKSKRVQIENVVNTDSLINNVKERIGYEELVE